MCFLYLVDPSFIFQNNLVFLLSKKKYENENNLIYLILINYELKFCLFFLFFFDLLNYTLDIDLHKDSQRSWVRD